jgi:hypothetical protein
LSPRLLMLLFFDGEKVLRCSARLATVQSIVFSR